MKRNRRVSGRPSTKETSTRDFRASGEPLSVVPLTVPILDGTEHISELRFMRRPNFGDLEAADAATGGVGRVLILTARLTGLTPREAREIDARDVEAVSEAVAALLEGEDEDDAVPPTGEP